MASLMGLIALAKGSAVELTTQEALSGIFGSISLAAWIFLLLPQLLENYKQKSAHGISLLFLSVWFVGDITNLIGAAWASLVPTVIALAVYFCFADLVLIMQCLYYNILNQRLEARAAKNTSAIHDASLSTVDGANERTRPRVDSTGSNLGEEAPLLGRQQTNDSNIGLPGSRRRKSSAASRRPSSRRQSDSLAKILEENQNSKAREALKNLISMLLVCAAGTMGWAIAWKTGVWRPAALPANEPGKGDTPFGAELLGYVSAVCYLGARIPQIVKNWREKSCDGLSLLFFLLSLLGNLTYGAGILFHSLDEKYVMVNLPWLIGSLGTMFEDITIFIQFHMYGDKSESSSIED